MSLNLNCRVFKNQESKVIGETWRKFDIIGKKFL